MHGSEQAVRFSPNQVVLLDSHSEEVEGVPMEERQQFNV